MGEVGLGVGLGFCWMVWRVVVGEVMRRSSFVVVVAGIDDDGDVIIAYGRC